MPPVSATPIRRSLLAVFLFLLTTSCGSEDSPRGSAASPDELIAELEAAGGALAEILEDDIGARPMSCVRSSGTSYRAWRTRSRLRRQYTRG